MLGTIAAAGIDPIGALDRWSWEQASLVADLLEDRAADRADLVVVPLVAVAGGRFKGYADGRRKARARGAKRAADAELPPDERDAAKLAELARLGIPVREVRAPGPEDGDEGKG